MSFAVKVLSIWIAFLAVLPAIVDRLGDSKQAVRIWHTLFYLCMYFIIFFNKYLYESIHGVVWRWHPMSLWAVTVKIWVTTVLMVMYIFFILQHSISSWIYYGCHMLEEKRLGEIWSFLTEVLILFFLAWTGTFLEHISCV